MRVAFVSEYAESAHRVVGGVQAVVRRLAKTMAARPGFHVHAVSVEPGRTDARTDDVEGVTVHRLPATARFGNLTMGHKERQETARVLREIGADIVHAHVLGPPALGAADSGLPWIATAHGMQADEGRLQEGWVSRVRSAATVRMERMSLDRLSDLIVISPYVEEYFRDRLRGIRTHAIENPVAGRFFDVEAWGGIRPSTWRRKSSLAATARLICFCNAERSPAKGP